MTNGQNFDKIVETARDHYMHVKSDIANAKDRVEHIRLTALAQEAHNLLTDLISYETGIPKETVDLNQEALDLPDFKNPYKPED